MKSFQEWLSEGLNIDESKMGTKGPKIKLMIEQIEKMLTGLLQEAGAPKGVEIMEWTTNYLTLLNNKIVQSWVDTFSTLGTYSQKNRKFIYVLSEKGRPIMHKNLPYALCYDSDGNMSRTLFVPNSRYVDDDDFGVTSSRDWNSKRKIKALLDTAIADGAIKSEQ